MPAVLILAFQAIAGPPAPMPARARVERPCPADDGSGDVVVCGRPDQERFRLRPLPAEGPALPKAELGLFGRAKVAAETEQGNVGGYPSNRIMFRLKLPL